MTALEIVGQEKLCTTLVNGSNLAFNQISAICSQQYYPYPRYCSVSIN